MLTVKGLVLRERPSGETSKILYILTDKIGIINVFAKGVRKTYAKNFASAQVLTYSALSVSYVTGKNYYILKSAQPIRSFYDLSSDAEKFALVNYFCQMVLYTCPKNQFNLEVYRLLLNCLHFLSNGKIDQDQLKAIFELRLLSNIGYAPFLIGCCRCYKYEDPNMVFDLYMGRIYCSDCCKLEDLSYARPINATILHALRHIVFSDMSRLFNFRLPNEHLKVLSSITEDFASIQLDKRFSVIEHYNTLKYNGR